MKQPLEKMTNEELWRLFPIRLTAPQDCWADWFREERAFVRTLLPEESRVSHIGSTAVGTIWAKPIVDILVEADGGWDTVQRRLSEGGYRLMSASDDRLSFNKGYTQEGFAERVFHLHLRRAGDHDELYFRDYLMDHPETARAYEAMKLELWRRFEHDRDGYTEAKTAFVRECTEAAKRLYAGRYEGTM